MTPDQIELRIRQRDRLDIRQQIMVRCLPLTRLVEHLGREVDSRDLASRPAPVAVAAGTTASVQHLRKTVFAKRGQKPLRALTLQLIVLRIALRGPTKCRRDGLLIHRRH